MSKKHLKAAGKKKQEKMQKSDAMKSKYEYKYTHE